MKPLNALPSDQKTALLEGIAALCRIFWGPDKASCEAIHKGDLFWPFEMLASSLDVAPPETLDRIRDEATGFSNRTALHCHLEETYVRLFISGRDGVIAPLYQSCYAYENAPLMGAPAEEMNARFRSKGLSLDETRHEPPDHISLELEYLYFLLDSGWALKDTTLLAEAAVFAAMMISWVTKLREKLEGETQVRFYGMAISLLIALLEGVTSGENSA